jgi:hypothetical protein
MNDEDKKKLADLMTQKFIQMREDAAIRRSKTSVCSLTLHPFLGKPPWKDVCPICGWDANKEIN